MPRRLMAPLAEPALVQAKLPSGGAGGRKLLQGSRFVAPLAEPLVAVVPAETVPTTGRRLQQNEAAVSCAALHASLDCAVAPSSRALPAPRCSCQP